MKLLAMSDVAATLSLQFPRQTKPSSESHLGLLVWDHIKSRQSHLVCVSEDPDRYRYLESIHHYIS
jgi:hypothetical protein